MFCNNILKGLKENQFLNLKKPINIFNFELKETNVFELKEHMLNKYIYVIKTHTNHITCKLFLLIFIFYYYCILISMFSKYSIHYILN
jgi:hypothetical protein